MQTFTLKWLLRLNCFCFGRDKVSQKLSEWIATEKPLQPVLFGEIERILKLEKVL
jgi:hypothetical protein